MHEGSTLLAGVGDCAQEKYVLEIADACTEFQYILRQKSIHLYKSGFMRFAYQSIPDKVYQLTGGIPIWKGTQFPVPPMSFPRSSTLRYFDP